MNAEDKGIVVLGANGFIGRYVVKRLKEIGCPKLYGYGRLFEPVDLPVDGWFQGDFVSGAGLREALAKSDRVIHLISPTNPTTAERNKILDIEANIRGTIQLLELCVETNIKKLIFCSSGGTVYGTSTIDPIDEECPTRPISFYGAGKLIVENYLSLYAFHEQLRATVLRVGNVYGPGQRSDKGQGLIGMICEKLKQKKTLQIWGDGSAIRDYVHVQDVADAIIAACCSDNDSWFNIYNVASGEGKSVNTVIADIEGIIMKKIERNYVSSRSFDVARNVLNVRKIDKELGWKPKIPWRTGLKETLDYYLK